MSARYLLAWFWNRLGLATSVEAAAAGKLGQRLDRWEKSAGRVTERLDRSQEQTAAIAEALEALKASVETLQQSVETIGDRLQLLATVRKQDLQADGAMPRVVTELEGMADAIEARIERVTAGLTVSTEPFPHVVIDELLPVDLYRTMLESLPPREFWRSSGRGRDYWEIETDVGPWPTEAVWRFVDRRIVNEILRPRLERAFDSHLARFWRDNFDMDPACVRYRIAEGRLQLRRKGYRLRPHLDPPHAALTGLYYLARPGDDARYGTALYKPSSPIPVKRQGIYYPEDQGIAVEHVTTVPFRANSLLVWMTSLGPHGADLTAEEVPKSLERCTYQFQLVTDDETRRRMKAR